MDQPYNSPILVKILCTKRNMAKYNCPFTQKHFCKIAYTLHTVIFTSCPQQRPVQSCKTVLRCWCLFCMLIKCALKSSSVTRQYCYLWIRWMQRVCNSRKKKPGSCWCLLWNTKTRWLDQNAKLLQTQLKQTSPNTHTQNRIWMMWSFFVMIGFLVYCGVKYPSMERVHKATEYMLDWDWVRVRHSGSRERCGLGEQTVHTVKRVTVCHSKALKSSTVFKHCSSFNITPVQQM